MKLLTSATAFALTLASAISAPQAIANSPNIPITSGLPHSAQVPQTQLPRSQDNFTPAKDTTPRSQNIPSTEKPSKENISGSRADNSYPAYCFPLPPGVTKGDWLYREAIYNCKSGT